MDLLVIVVCLLSERFLIHKSAHNRFHWFMSWANGVLSKTADKYSPWVLLAIVVLPLLIPAWLVLHLFGHLLFGIVGLVLNIALFYYCLGPVNPFYPVHAKPNDQLIDEDIAHYLVKVNGELFAVLFWYLVLGPTGILAYRLISLSRNLSAVNGQAVVVLNWFDWIPVRMTALFYLVVGNFQVGFRQYKTQFLTSPENNVHFLSGCAMAALDTGTSEQKPMIQAEILVEHATIVFLVLLAFCTIVAWV